MIKKFEHLRKTLAKNKSWNFVFDCIGFIGRMTITAIVHIFFCDK